MTTSKIISNPSAASPLRGLLVWVITLILLINGVVFIRMARQSVQMEKLNKQYEQARASHASAVEIQKIRLMALSVSNELAGWKKRKQSSFFLEKLAEIPTEELVLQDFSFIRYLHLDALPESQENPLINVVLTLTGEIFMEVCEAQKGCGEYAFPWFLEEIRNGINTPLSYEQRSLLYEDPHSRKARILNIKLPAEYLWESIN